MKKVIIYIVIFIISLYILFSAIFINQQQNTDKKEVIRFSTWGSQSEKEILTSIIADFEQENPNIKIELLHIPQNYFQKIHLLFASGLEPDVVFINNQNIQMYINANLLEDLSPFFPQANKMFFNESLNCFKNENKLYAIPRDISNLVIYYNKDIFDKKNIPIPIKISNIYELKELAKKLSDKKVFGINFEEDSLFWRYYLASNGGGIISDDKKNIIINSEKSIKALDLYTKMIQEHIAPSKSEIGSMTTAQMFINGKLAMYLSGRWMVPKFRETLTFDWDIIEFPSNETNKLYIDASGWALTKNAKNKENSIKLIKYLSSKESINKFTKSGLIVPARIDSAYSNIFLDSNTKPKNSIAYLNMLKNSKPTPVNENYSSINDIINEQAQTIFSREKNASDAYDNKIIKKLESLL